jgi:putative membrane protein insertion efficiency factor
MTGATSLELAPTWGQRHALAWIERYQHAFAGRPSPCRFYPTCSQYSHDAIELHGTGRGLWLTLRRLARCRPFGPSGFDPVPEPAPRQVARSSRPTVRRDA